MKNYIKVTIFILILLMLIMLLNKLFVPVGTYEGGWYASGAMQDMYKQEENTIDVLYVGDSNVYAGISPMEIYNLRGITGFSASTPAQDVIGSYYVIKEFFKKQKPKVVMLDTGEFFTKIENITELSKRSEIDFMKFGKNKLDVINDNDFEFSNYEKLTYIFPILKFHTRYKRLTEFDIRKIIQKSEMSYKGYLYDCGVKKYEKKRKESKNAKEENIEPKTQNLEIPEYINKKIEFLKEFCIQNESELVLIYMPTTDELLNKKNEILEQFAKEKEIKYINFNLNTTNPIDWATDTQDAGAHLNIYGSEKVASYIVKFLDENFEIKNKKEDERYKTWNEELEGYLLKKSNK